jgi:molybdopterin molybdotransferase
MASTQAILSFEDARHLVEHYAAKLGASGTEEVELLAAIGRVLSEPIFADRPFPPFPRAARDGYAVRSADLTRIPARLRVIGEIKAGAAADVPPLSVGSGEAAAIMTGAPVPSGADAVVMVEYTSRDGELVEISKGVDAGANIVPTGSEAHLGEQLLVPGMWLDHAAIAVAASVGKSRLQVWGRPRVAVLATGDEIVGPDATPGRNQIRNSNSYSIAAQILAAGGEPVLLPIAPDEPVRLRSLIREGLQADLLLLAGGVSMGKYDLVEQVLAQLGAEFFFTGVRIQPGKPAVFGRIKCGADTAAPESQQVKYFVGLPGNPVSTMVTFELFAKPLIQALVGLLPQRLVFVYARLKSEIKTKTGLKRFLPAVFSGEFERAEVELAHWQGSGDIAAMVRSNCYLVIPSNREHIPAGDWVPVLLR